MPKKHLKPDFGAESAFAFLKDGEEDIFPSAEFIRSVIDDCLTEKQKKYLKSRYYGRSTLKEIAKSCGVSVPTVSRTLKRAEKRIRAALKYSLRR